MTKRNKTFSSDGRKLFLQTQRCPVLLQMLSTQAKWSSDILESQSTVYGTVPPPPKTTHICTQFLFYYSCCCNCCYHHCWYCYWGVWLGFSFPFILHWLKLQNTSYSPQSNFLPHSYDVSKNSKGVWQYCSQSTARSYHIRDYQILQ